MKKKTFDKPVCRIYTIGQNGVISTSASAPQRNNVSTEEYEEGSTEGWF